MTMAENQRPYPGSGTESDPFVVDWLEGDPENPYNWPRPKKWAMTYLTAFAVLCIAFSSSSYSGGIGPVIRALHASQDEAILGVSLYVLGFGLGPLIFAPFSETFGRRKVFIGSYLPFTLFHLGGALAQNVPTLLITRFFAGACGSAPLTNSGGIIADIWNSRDRGTATTLFAMAPFMGPVLGPAIGGYISQSSLGWRFNFWIMFIFSAVMLVLNILFVPETYAPILLRRRADQLEEESGGRLHYITRFEKGPRKTLTQSLKINMSRPFVFLFLEPIVTLLSIYVAIIYGILYGLFAAYPIVFQQTRHFTPGEGGLAFLGVGLGVAIGSALSPINDRYYIRVLDRRGGTAPPEIRLILACYGGFLLPIGLFWFAWTTFENIHWIVPILSGIPFGMGMLFLFLPIIAYLIDSYLMYAASALAANALLRSLLGAAFPLFTGRVYHAVGNQWGASIFAFMSLACAPMPLLFYIYGSRIRARSKYAVSDKPVDDNEQPEQAQEPTSSRSRSEPSSVNEQVVAVPDAGPALKDEKE
jgi:multidrug resistance protein